MFLPSLNQAKRQLSMRLSINHDAPINNIVIITAMQSEADPIVKKLGMKEVKAQSLGFKRGCIKIYRASINCRFVYLVLNGKDPVFGVDRVSAISAALTAAETINALKPDLIISAGVAGGVKKSHLKIGDVIVSDSEPVFCDRVIMSINNPAYRLYGTGYFKYLKINAIAEKLRIIPGIVATESSLDPTDRDLKELQMLNADTIDMEAAAVAQVAQDVLITNREEVVYKDAITIDSNADTIAIPVRFMALKAIVNFLDPDLHTDMKKNFEKAIDKLAEKVQNLLPHIIGAKPSELAIPKAKL
jgi:5'-methylthioadenosine nucleosidase